MKMVANVFLLLFLILCAYALMGKSLFGNLFVSQDCKTNVLTTCNYLGDFVPNNFDNFFRSILTLFAVMTFDGEFVNDLNSWTACLLASSLEFVPVCFRMPHTPMNTKLTLSHTYRCGWNQMNGSLLCSVDCKLQAGNNLFTWP